MSLDEVAAIYLPLSRLLNLYVGATQRLHEASNTFLGAAGPRMPYVIGVAGSVAVGKSTMSRILQALLARWPSHPQVDLITTDGFLLPQRVLEARGMAHRKGFPGELRRADARSLPGRREVRRARGRRARVTRTSPTTSCPASSRSSASRTS